MEKVLSHFGYSDCKPISTPYDASVILKNKRIVRDQLKYSQIIGSLMYLASATRPDISFVVSKLSRFVSNPADDHWKALDRVMLYLKGTMDCGIHYTGYPRILEGYSDSIWISDADKIKSHEWICVYTWRWHCFLEVLQADHLKEVNNGSRTNSNRYHHC